MFLVEMRKNKFIKQVRNENCQQNFFCFEWKGVFILELKTAQEKISMNLLVYLRKFIMLKVSHVKHLTFFKVILKLWLIIDYQTK